MTKIDKTLTALQLAENNRASALNTLETACHNNLGDLVVQWAYKVSDYHQQVRILTGLLARERMEYIQELLGPDTDA